MVDGDERDVPRERRRLGPREPDEQGTDETGTGRRGDGVDPPIVDARLDDRRATTGSSSSAWARRDSGTTPPNRAWISICELTDVDTPSGPYDGGGRLVATRLDAEHARAGPPPRRPPRVALSGSSRSRSLAQPLGEVRRPGYRDTTSRCASSTFS